MSEKIKIGLTGGIGSGKSTVADFLRKKGIKVFDADRLAKELMTSDEELKRELIKEFGEETFSGGELNREYLANTIFVNPAKVEKINSIVHPVVKNKLTSLMNKELEKSNLVAAEAALIFEADMTEMFDYIWVVTADEETRIKRVMERSGLSREEIIKRMENQIPEKEKISRADFVFYNNNSVEKLEENVSFMLSIIQKI